MLQKSVVTSYLESSLHRKKELSTIRRAFDIYCFISFYYYAFECKAYHCGTYHFTISYLEKLNFKLNLMWTIFENEFKILTNFLLRNRGKKITKAICTHSLFFTKSFVLSFCKSRVEVSCQNQTFSEKFPPLRRKTTSLFLTSGKFFEYIRIHYYHTFGLCGNKIFRLNRNVN